jgi:hypothetical protein
MQLEKRNFNNQWNKTKNNNYEEKTRPSCFPLGFGAWGLICSFGKGDQTINSLKVEL